MGRDATKRGLDISVSLVGLVLTAPAQALIAVLIRYRLGAPVLFRQDRPGKHERVFELVKFRTMLEPNIAAGLLDDEQRLTRLGGILRSTSLDELPTLWNVLKGDMSLVGPRPLLVDYLPLYTTHQRRRHDVRPGVTGLAQVNGRNAITWDSKLDLDVEYVDRRSLWLDLQILGQTFRAVFTRSGITADGLATTTRFEGSE